MFPSLALLPVALAACGPRPFLDTGPCQDRFEDGGAATCEVPGHPGRDYDVVLPEGYDADQPVPVILALHGGGGNKEGAGRTTCATGEPDDPGCLHQVAGARGYAVVFPDGTPGKLLPNSRTWNAGGGVDDWRCTSGRACDEGVDDVAYFDALLVDLATRVAVDPARVFVTGLSNGGAMSHRLACERAGVVAAVAPVGGAMQLTTSDVCAPDEPVAVLHVHGTEDPCWRYEGGVPDCPTGQRGLAHVSVERTLDEWAGILSCGGDIDEEALPDTVDDGTTTVRQRWAGCDAALEHLRIDGGGHAWPDGDPYLSERTIGVVPRDLGSEVIVDFFDAVP